MVDEKGLPGILQQQTILALNHFGQVVTSSLALEDVLERILAQVAALLQPEGVAIAMPVDDGRLKFVAVSGPGAVQLKEVTMPGDEGVVGHVMRTGESVWLNSEGSNVPGLGIYRPIETISRFHSQSLLAAPLIAEGQVIGVLEAVHSRSDSLVADDLATLTAAANWAAIAIANAQLHEQAQKLREEQAALEERARLARELHDVVTQSLYSMAVLAGAWRRQIEAGQLQPNRDQIAELGELAQSALREVRLLIYELRPTELQEEGLIGALYRRLEAVEQRAGIQARLFVTDEADQPLGYVTGGREAAVEFYRLPSAIELGLYRIAQEALNNVLKHSGATEVTLRIRLGAETLSMEIEDNGRGFEAGPRPSPNGGFGMTGLKERAKQMGGYLSIASSPGRGTTVRIADIPYRSAGIEELRN